MNIYKWKSWKPASTHQKLWEGTPWVMDKFNSLNTKLSQIQYTLKRTCHFDEIFIIDYTWSCQNDNNGVSRISLNTVNFEI